VKLHICKPMALLLTLSLLNACTGNKDSAVYSTVSASAILGSPSTPAEKAEEIAKKAEFLMTKQGFLQAADMVDLALKQDPTNFRAQLMKAMLGPVLEMKGMNVRVKPLFEKDKNLLELYKSEIEKDKAKPTSAFKDFLYDGKPDITTEEQLQASMDTFTEKLDELRVFLRNVKVPEIKMRANTALISDLNSRFAQACEIKETAEYEYELKCPPSADRYDVILNQADFAQWRDYIATQEIQFAVYGSYDMSGLFESVAVESSEDAPTMQKITDRLFQNPKFGKLRPNQKMARIKEFMMDYTSGLRSAMKDQTTLCPGGYPSPKNRPGKVYNTGICAPSYYFTPFVEKIELLTSGKVNRYAAGPMVTGQSVDILPMKVLEAPVADLRSYGALKFTKCGDLDSAGDAVFGGVFPNADANVVFNANRNACHE
jgi:hypothetical protein